MALLGLFAARRKETVIAMVTQQYPRSLYKPPTSAPKPSAHYQELSLEEKAALWDEAQALHQQARDAQLEIDRLRFRQQSLKGKRDALFERGGSRNIDFGPCSQCGFSNCVCERMG